MADFQAFDASISSTYSNILYHIFIIFAVRSAAYMQPCVPVPPAWVRVLPTMTPAYLSQPSDVQIHFQDWDLAWRTPLYIDSREEIIIRAHFCGPGALYRV